MIYQLTYLSLFSYAMPVAALAFLLVNPSHSFSLTCPLCTIPNHTPFIRNPARTYIRIHHTFTSIISTHEAHVSNGWLCRLRSCCTCIRIRMWASIFSASRSLLPVPVHCSLLSEVFSQSPHNNNNNIYNNHQVERHMTRPYTRNSCCTHTYYSVFYFF